MILLIWLALRNMHVYIAGGLVNDYHFDDTNNILVGLMKKAHTTNSTGKRVERKISVPLTFVTVGPVHNDFDYTSTQLLRTRL